MTNSSRSRVLIVDDEEAILETMMYTFEDEYDVFTSTSPLRALEILDEQGPISVVISDQRMPEMTGVEFLSNVVQRHPATVRIILTGFADMNAIIQAINDGHVYAYITKPWEPDDLMQVVKRAVDHYNLTVENQRLLKNLKHSNSFLEAVMDRLHTGALAIDPEGTVQASNHLAREYFSLGKDPCGQLLKDRIPAEFYTVLMDAVERISSEGEGARAEIESATGAAPLSFKLAADSLIDSKGSEFGRVIFVREVSHRPLCRCFDGIIGRINSEASALGPILEDSVGALQSLAEEVDASPIDSPGMLDLRDRISRAGTAIENWLVVGQALSGNDLPDARRLNDRMRLAASRWPSDDDLPKSIRELAEAVEGYYESGERPSERIL